MTFAIHTYDVQQGWSLTKQSSSLDDFDNFDDKWAFNHILTEGVEYIQMGDTMWDVWEDDNEQ
jgi:hypothetical protein